jgi:hypothetical protein
VKRGERGKGEERGERKDGKQGIENNYFRCKESRRTT